MIADNAPVAVIMMPSPHRSSRLKCSSRSVLVETCFISVQSGQTRLNRPQAIVEA